jgi:hypothetical protein
MARYWKRLYPYLERAHWRILESLSIIEELARPDKEVTNEAFVDLKQALEDALAFELGKRCVLRSRQSNVPALKGQSRPRYPTKAEPL